MPRPPPHPAPARSHGPTLVHYLASRERCLWDTSDTRVVSVIKLAQVEQMSGKPIELMSGKPFELMSGKPFELMSGIPMPEVFATL
jgi:hypothetical protein